MIYIFKSIQFVCTLPATLCKECGNLLGKIHCEPCRECCRDASKMCTDFMGKPLSTYVVIAFVISGIELYMCFLAMDDQGTCQFDKDSSVQGFGTWVYVQVGFAILNLVFAPYFQCKVWQRLTEALKDNVPDADGKIVVPKSDVQQAFKHVFLYDFGVLFYFFAACVSFVWSILGMKWMTKGTSCEAVLLGKGGAGAYLGMCLCWVALAYLFTWYCCECCARSVEIHMDPFKHEMKTGVLSKERDLESESDE